VTEGERERLNNVNKTIKKETLETFEFKRNPRKTPQKYLSVEGIYEINRLYV